MADPLSVVAGVTGLLCIAGAILKKGYSVARSLTGSTKTVHCLLMQLSQLTGVLVAPEAQEKEAQEARAW
jgi:hypothetical protein